MGNLTRRNLFKGAGLAAFSSLAGCGGKTGTKTDIVGAPYLDYASIGIEPVINCWGAMTTMGGSLILPEAQKAMMEAANSFVRMGELMEGVGKKLSELTGAEWGVITSGCAAALFVATSGIITGGDPKLVAKLPDTEGMKNECIVSSGHRTGYDCAVKMAGIRMIEVDSPEAMEAAFNEKTAMIFVLGEFLFAPREVQRHLAEGYGKGGDNARHAAPPGRRLFCGGRICEIANRQIQNLLSLVHSSPLVT